MDKEKEKFSKERDISYLQGKIQLRKVRFSI